MLKCEKCQRKFNYKEIFKSQRSFKEIECPKCSQKYTVKWYSKLITSILIALPIFFVYELIDIMDVFILVAYVLWCVFIFGLMPLFNKYNIKM